MARNTEGICVSAPQPKPPEVARPTGLFVAFGFLLAAMVFSFDQASKLALLYLTDIRLTYPWALTSFLDFTVVWNRGISYGLFQQNTELGRWVLTAIKLGAAIILSFWLRKAENRAEATGIGLIIGGAIGNAIDRVIHGAVFDFVHFHIGTFSWYVFNVADASIVIGVILMVVGPFLLFAKDDRAQNSP
jgi:signal peptidase II